LAALEGLKVLPAASRYVSHRRRLLERAIQLLETETTSNELTRILAQLDI